ncbi:MAG: hypothetical protein SPF56_07460 [Bacteroidaceae bacterium]|nr:hypothetical protein [Prevotellaceae bacterium]MDY5632305.1 hypothetical protein [Bacteroidaceae bacterium]
MNLKIQKQENMYAKRSYIAPVVSFLEVDPEAVLASSPFATHKEAMPKDRNTDNYGREEHFNFEW